MKINTLLAAGAVCAAAATGAYADTFQKYGEAEGWNVFVDVEKRTCLIETKDDLDNVVQMGLTEDRSVAYLGVFAKGETDIKKGQKEAVAVMIGENLYVGEATGMRGNITKGYSGGYILTDDPRFVEDIAKQHVMTVFPETTYGFSVDLAGTYKALEMARECNAKQMQ
ncbi:hypothetical protein [Primorskyibacter sp. S87]|uniref:hypothetical protein n=1 Tax=Primorskyibacter sp. S87 TaxID=3415126 RepID=UPI003C7ABEB9